MKIKNRIKKIRWNYLKVKPKTFKVNLIKHLLQILKIFQVELLNQHFWKRQFKRKRRRKNHKIKK